MQDIMSDDILAWGGSSSFCDGLRLWLRHDSSNATKASACCSIESVSLKKIILNTINKKTINYVHFISY